jgi:nitroreductase
MLPLADTTKLVLTVPDLARWADGFNTAKRAEGLSPRTLVIYREKLAAFVTFALGHGVQDAEHIDPDLIRQWLLTLEERGHNPGGVAQFYRVLKTFLLWYEAEAAADGWVAAVACREVGYALAVLGGGRRRVEDSLDLSAGILFHARVGDRVARGQPLATLLCRDRDRAETAARRLRAAVTSFLSVIQHMVAVIVGDADEERRHVAASGHRHPVP